MQSRKQQLTDAVIDYLLVHGVSDLSLRPLADAVGTSARLLIYHFESKEGLLVEVLGRMQTRLRQSLAGLASRSGAGRKQRPLRLFWNWAVGAKNYPYLKLLYELQVLAARDPETYGHYLQNNAADWSGLIGAMLPAGERTPAMTTLLAAVFDGLFLELMSTGDRQRATRTIDAFIRLVDDARAYRSVPRGKLIKTTSSKRE